MVLCEAFCLGLPIVSTKTTGPVELIDNDKYGLLTEHDDESIYQAVKKMIDDEMGYFFGFPKGCYSEVLGELARTKVNSCCTSSIPLAEFWQPENLGKIKSLLGEAIPGFRPEASLLKLRNMKFLILSVPVVNLAEVDAKHGSRRGELFELMRDETIYKIDFGGIAVETVVDAKMPDGKEER